MDRELSFVQVHVIYGRTVTVALGLSTAEIGRTGLLRRVAEEVWNNVSRRPPGDRYDHRTEVRPKAELIRNRSFDAARLTNERPTHDTQPQCWLTEALMFDRLDEERHEGVILSSLTPPSLWP